VNADAVSGERADVRVDLEGGPEAVQEQPAAKQFVRLGAIQDDDDRSYGVTTEE
jgi:hypothetical protein